MMDHEGEDSGFNLYEHYGASMDDDEVAVVDDTAFPMHGWDHHASVAEDGSGAGVYPDITGDNDGYDAQDSTMEDFNSTQYGHGFHQTQHFEGDSQEFQNFMADQHDHHQGNQTAEYDINSMELYHTPTLYPNLTQSQQNTPQYVDQITPSSTVSVPQESSNNSNSSHGITAEQALAHLSEPSKDLSLQVGRQSFKFTNEQKQKMMDKFNAGLHYPTPAEKEAIGKELGAAADSVSRWFERTRKEKGVQRIRTKAGQEPKQAVHMPQYLPIQSLQPQQQQSQNPQQQQPQQTAPIFPSYGQFPSTYPYNTLDPQFFQQNFSQNIQPTTVNPATINPSAGIYAPIPFVNQSIRPGIQENPSSQSNGQQFQPQVMILSAQPKNISPPQPNQQSQFTVQSPNQSQTEGVYTDDNRNVKRPKIEKVTLAPQPLAPKPVPPKKPMTFEQEVQSIMRPSEWREDPSQAAEDLYDLMGDAEEDPARKQFLLRTIRNNATETALRAISSEENRRVLAKLRNWFTAGIKSNDTPLLSVILEVIKKMNLDGRTMAGIKMGKALILLMKKDEPTLKAQLASLSKTAYEAYALEKDGGSKSYTSGSDGVDGRLKVDSPVATITPTTATTSSSAKEAVKAPVKAVVEKKPVSVVPTKIKAADKPATGASFFGKLASAQQAPPTITKTPVPSKPIPKRSTSTTSTAHSKPPPKPPTTTKPPATSTTSKFSVLEYIKPDTSTSAAPSTNQSAPNTKKRKRVSWAGEDKLEQVKMIENITIKYAEDLFWHPPQGFGNARDLDIGEGMVFGKDTVEDEEEIEWYEPKLFDFSALPQAEDRYQKRAGTKLPEIPEATKEKQRENGVLLVTYLNEADIPESPSEPFLEELVASQQSSTPKMIPLPQELRTPAPPQQQQQPLQPMGNPDVTAILSSLLGSHSAPTTTQSYQPPLQIPQIPLPAANSNVQSDLASLLQSLTGQSSLPPPPPPPTQGLIPANIDLSALLSHLQPQPPPQQQQLFSQQSLATGLPPQQQQRWTSPPPPTREKRQKRDRDPTTRIKASRMDDVRDSVRNSQADQNQYRALCQFYKMDSCKLGNGCTFVHPRDMSMYDYS